MRWLVPALACVVAGCITPAHEANVRALAPEGSAAEWPLTERGRVHVFVVNGNDPFETDRLATLRGYLHDAGFAKVSIAGLFFVPLFESTIRDLHRNDPYARFLIVGNGFGAAFADGLAQRLHSEGIPVDAVIALSPLQVPFFEAAGGSPVPRVVIRAGESPSSFERFADRVYRVHDATAAAGDAATAELVTQAMVESLGTLPTHSDFAPAVLPMIDDPAPRPGRVPVARHPQPSRPPVQGVLTGTHHR